MQKNNDNQVHTFVNILKIKCQKHKAEAEIVARTLALETRIKSKRQKQRHNASDFTTLLLQILILDHFHENEINSLARTTRLCILALSFSVT